MHPVDDEMSLETIVFDTIFGFLEELGLSYEGMSMCILNINEKTNGLYRVQILYHYICSSLLSKSDHTWK